MELASYSDSEILAIIEPLMDNMLAGSTEIDHAKHVRDFTHRLKVIVTEDNLSRQWKTIRSDLAISKNAKLSLFSDAHIPSRQYGGYGIQNQMMNMYVRRCLWNVMANCLSSIA